MRAQNELYIGPSGSGKSAALSRYLLEEAYKNPDKNYILIVPDQSASAYEKRLLRMNGELFGISGLLNVDILGMSRLAFRIFEEYDVPSGRVLEEFERSMMVRAACSKVAGMMKVYGNSIDKKGFITKAKSLISELLQFGISLEDLKLLIDKLVEAGSVSLADKLSDIKLIYEEITVRFLWNAGAELPEGRMKLLAECLRNNNVKSMVDNAVIVFDEFRGFTPDQFDIIEALENRAERMIFSLTMEGWIVQEDKTVREHELYYQSYITYKTLMEILVQKPVIKYYKRGTDLSRFNEGSGLEHLEKGIFRFPIHEYAGVPEDIEIWRADDQVIELSVVAEDILRQVRTGARYKDFAVVTADMQGLSAYADGIFRSYGIPVFIDESRSFGKNPFTEGLIKLLQIIDKDFNYDSIFGFIKLGLMDDDISGALDVLENHALRHGIRGRRSWEKIIEVSRDSLDEELKDEIVDDYMNCERARSAIMELLIPMLVLDRKCEKVSNITRALRTMMAPEKLDYEGRIELTVSMYERLGKHAEANALKGLFEKLCTIFDSIDEMLGDEEMSIHDYLEILSSGIEDMKLGVIPPTLDAVVVADCERSRLDRVKTIYFINMNEGILPAVSSGGKLLSDRDKDRIEEVFNDNGIRKKLAPNDRIQSYMEQFYIYQMLTKPEQKLVLSYADAARDGSSMEISYVLGRIKRLFPELKEERRVPEPFSGTRETDIYDFTSSVRQAMNMLRDRSVSELEKEDTFNRTIQDIADFRKLDPECFCYDADAILYSNQAENLPQDILKDLKLEISVSKMESYAGCPYSYFLRYILKLSPREERQLGALDVGNILHRALELTGESVKNDFSNDWKKINDKSLTDVAEKALDKALSENEFFRDESETERGKNNVIRNELADLMGRTVKTIKYQIGQGGMIPEAFEQTFSATFKASRPDGETVPITINGKIDRLDSFETDGEKVFRIIDYKTGDKAFDPDRIKAGTDLQLAVYMDIIKEIFKRDFKDKDVIPAGMYYYHVANPDVSELSEKQIAGAGGDESLAAELEQYKLLRMKGAVNIDDPEKHKIAKLQEDGIVDDSGNFGKGTVVPIDKGRGEEFSKSTSAIVTSQLEGLGLYSRNKMVDITEQILEGDIRKQPVRFGKQGKVKCVYCDYKQICRFGIYGGRVNYVPDRKESAVVAISAMTQDVRERVNYDRMEQSTTKSSGKSE